MTANNPRSSVHLSHQERLRLLHDLDADAPASPHKSKRRHERYEYHRDDIPITITHPGGERVRFIVASRNLSASGMSFLHGGFLHLKTECLITLTTETGEKVLVNSRVVACRYLTGRIHEICVAFQNIIDPECFTGTYQTDSGSTSPAAARVSGRALYVGHDDGEQAAIAAELTAMGMTIESAHCLGAALDHIKRNITEINLIITELELDNLSPEHILASIRRTAFRGPVIGLSWGAGPADDLPGKTQKGVSIVAKPHDPEVLQSLVNELLAPAGNTTP